MREPKALKDCPLTLNVERKFIALETVIDMALESILQPEDIQAGMSQVVLECQLIECLTQRFLHTRNDEALEARRDVILTALDAYAVELQKRSL